MQKFVEKYLDPSTPLRVLDVGSQDVNGSYKPLFTPWEYTGADMSEGKNVDIVISDIYIWNEWEEKSFDVVVCGQTLEHVEYPWITMQEIARVVKPGGLVCIIVPSTGPEHKYPLDCWRMFTDGVNALAKYAELTILESYTDTEVNDWHDTVLIAQR